MIAEFMKACAPVEAYLQQGQPLTPLQLDSIATAISGLQTFLDVWKRKNIKR
jgi:hypothetical protein